MDPNAPDTEFHIEANGRLLGPGTLDQLRQAVADGRISADTIVVGVSTGQRWVAKDLPGLFDAPPPKIPDVVPPPVHVRSPVRRRAKPTPIATWIAAGVICSFCCFISGAILFPVFASARAAARHSMIEYSLKQLGRAALEYAGDNNDTFPPRMESATAVEPFVSRYLKNPEILKKANELGAVTLGDKRLNGMKMGSILDPSHTLLFYTRSPWSSNTVLFFFMDDRTKGGSIADLHELLSTDIVATSKSNPSSEP